MLAYQKVISRRGDKNKNLTIPEALASISPLLLYKELPEIFANARIIQEQVLNEILAQAKDSAYGRDHHFSEQIVAGTWLETAAITTYREYQPYIQREMSGEAHQLFVAQTTYYIATTGSTGKTKFFLESQAGNVAKQLVMTVRGMAMSAVLPITLDMEAKNLTISNYAPAGMSQDGKLILRASGQTARNMRKKTGTMNIIPVEFWDAEQITPWDRDYMMGVYALAEARFSKVFCNNLIHFGRVLDCINLQGYQMIEDIRRGDFSVPLTTEVRNVLRANFPPNPDRADQLTRIFKECDGQLDSPVVYRAIWPNLSMVSCWLSGSVGRDAREVLRRLPTDVKAFEMGYGASEGKFNIPTGLGSCSGVIASFAAFYEFLPLDGGAPLCMWEVEKGAYYELLITTYSGLYRYNLQDVVRIDDYIGNTPLISFCGKSTEHILVDREKIYGFQFAELIGEIEMEYTINFDLVQVFVKGQSFSYVLESQDEIDYQEIKENLDVCTSARWGIRSESLFVMKRSYKEELFTANITKNRGACGIKLPVIVTEIPPVDYIFQIIH